MVDRLHPKRFADVELESFHREFREHVKNEEGEHEQQGQIHDALFRLEDKDKGVSPGVIQLLGRVNDRLLTMEVAADRQKRFVGGVMFAFSCMGFFLTDSAHKLMDWLRGV